MQRWKKIHRIYDKYQKPNSPREIQAKHWIRRVQCNQISLGKFGLAVRPRGAQSHAQSYCPRDCAWDCAPWGLTAGPNCPWAVLVALDKSYLLAWISRGQFGFWYEVYIQSTGRACEGKTCVWWILYLLSLNLVNFGYIHSSHSTGGGPFDLCGSPFDVE